MNTSFLQGPLDGLIQAIPNFPDQGDVAICEAHDARYEYVYDWSPREMSFVFHSARKKSLTNKKVVLKMRARVVGKRGEYHPDGFIHAEAM
jgi:hypothetical protein